jgi:hypothetical protein
MQDDDRRGGGDRTAAGRRGHVTLARMTLLVALALFTVVWLLLAPGAPPL